MEARRVQLKGLLAAAGIGFVLPLGAMAVTSFVVMTIIRTTRVVHPMEAGGWMLTAAHAAAVAAAVLGYVLGRRGA